MSPVVAPLRYADAYEECRLSGVRRKERGHRRTVAFDPLRILGRQSVAQSGHWIPLKEGVGWLFDWSATFRGMTTLGRPQRRGAGIVLTDGGQKE
jgi:hypothetical protein